MKLISLTKGFKAKVDNEDYERVICLTWCVDQRANTNYAVSGSLNGNIRLHRFILNAEKTVIIHHKDNDGLNNQKNNLQITNTSINTALASRERGQTGFRGVTEDKRYGTFLAQARIDGHYYKIGTFKDATTAAIFRDQFVFQYRGKDGIYNFPEYLGLKNDS